MSETGVQTLPAGWGWTRLDEVIGPGVEQDGPREVNGDFIYVDISSVDNKAKRIVGPRRVPVEEAPSRARQRIEPADVLVSMTRPNLNAVALVPEEMRDAIATTGFQVLRTSSIAPEWLFYFVQSASFVDAMTRVVQGVVYPAVRPKDILSHRIPLAPLPEQRRIVAEIEKHFTRLDAAVAALERTRANLRRYRASVLKAACEGRLVPTEAELARAEGRDYEPASVLLERILKERRTKWEAEQTEKILAAGKEPKDEKWKLKYQEPVAPGMDDLPELPEGWIWAISDMLFTFVTSGSRGWAQYYSDEGPLFLRIGNLRRGSISLDLAEAKRVNPPPGAEGRRTRVSTSDLLISITADLGMVAVIPENLEEAYINQHIALARPVTCVEPSYIGWFLATDSGQSQLTTLQRGATKAGLGLDDIRSVSVPLPPIAEQRRILDEVERRLSVADELEATMELSLKRTVHLRQAILKRAFKGKLVPQHADDEPASVLLERIRTDRLKESQPPAKGRRKAEARPPRRRRRKTIADVLRSSPLGLPTEELIERCGYTAETVEKFYKELKKALDDGRVEEVRSGRPRVVVRLKSK